VFPIAQASSPFIFKWNKSFVCKETGVPAENQRGRRGDELTRIAW